MALGHGPLPKKIWDYRDLGNANIPRTLAMNSSVFIQFLVADFVFTYLFHIFSGGGQ